MADRNEISASPYRIAEYLFSSEPGFGIGVGVAMNGLQVIWRRYLIAHRLYRSEISNDGI